MIVSGIAVLTLATRNHVEVIGSRLLRIFDDFIFGSRVLVFFAIYGTQYI